jgi:hypothetical protein
MSRSPRRTSRARGMATHVSVRVLAGDCVKASVSTHSTGYCVLLLVPRWGPASGKFPAGEPRSVPMRDIGSAHFGAPFGESGCLTVSVVEPATPPRLLERGLRGCAGRNSAVVTLRTFSCLRCGTRIREHSKVIQQMSSHKRQRIPGEVMISDSKDRVSREALLRSEPVPAPWAAKFAWSQDWWWNQENGNIAGPHWAPSRDDVERMLGDVQGL